MPTYAVAKSKHATLTVGTVDTVTLPLCSAVEVLNRSTGEVYFTVNGAAPTVAGDNCYIAQAGQGLQVPLPVAWGQNAPTGVTVQLISSQAAAYSVTAL
jgi:hypothetical protein